MTSKLCDTPICTLVITRARCTNTFECIPTAVAMLLTDMSWHAGRSSSFEQRDQACAFLPPPITLAEKFVAAGVDVNALNEHKESALHVAALK